MTLQAAPHPIGVFRYLKQAWREWIATGNAATITVNTPAAQPAANPLTVTGTALVDVSVPKPVIVQACLMKGGVFQTQSSVPANMITGAWTATFPGGSTTASAVVTIFAITDYGTFMSPNFTLT
jgi:hypothetical protein